MSLEWTVYRCAVPRHSGLSLGKKIMKRELILTTLLIPLITTATPKYESTFEYAEKTKQLWGISSVTLEADGSVTLIDATNKGYGHGMLLLSSDNERADNITLRKGDKCVLSDHHASIIYLFKDISSASQLVFTVTDTFDARSFGDDIKEAKKDVVILPYNSANPLTRSEAISIATEAIKEVSTDADPNNTLVVSTNGITTVYFQADLPPGTLDGAPGQVSIDENTKEVVEVLLGP